MINKRIWEDQFEFNAQIRPHAPSSPEDVAAITKEFTLHQMTEMAEFLEAGKVFGAHRRIANPFINRENVRRQLIDQFKYWMSIAQAWGFTRDELERTYWAKSATVRQRFAEEWIAELDKPIAVLDLDGVLCDYIEGMCSWLVRTVAPYHVEGGEWLATRAAEVMAKRIWIDHQTFQFELSQWNHFQHEFRTSGEFARLRPMPYAREFVRWCHSQKLSVVALTSRPIDEYPNLYDDTVQWFKSHKLNVDRIWWGSNKAEKLAAMIPAVGDQVRFAVDDDPKFCAQLSELGVRMYWLTQKENSNNLSDITIVKRLEEICAKENER